MKLSHLELYSFSRAQYSLTQCPLQAWETPFELLVRGFKENPKIMEDIVIIIVL